LRGKKSITLNLRTSAGVDLFLRLAGRTDVVVENFLPGTLEQMGLGFEKLQAVNPRLILCSISGFGQTGPYRDWRAFDPVVQAMSGISSVTGYADRPPVRCGAAISDTTASLYGVIGTLSALRAREKTGHGDWIDVAMLDGSFFLMPDVLEFVTGGGEQQRRERKLRGEYRQREQRGRDRERRSRGNGDGNGSRRERRDPAAPSRPWCWVGGPMHAVHRPRGAEVDHRDGEGEGPGLTTRAFAAGAWTRAAEWKRAAVVGARPAAPSRSGAWTVGSVGVVGACGCSSCAGRARRWARAAPGAWTSGGARPTGGPTGPTREHRGG